MSTRELSKNRNLMYREWHLLENCDVADSVHLLICVGNELKALCWK